MIKNIQIINNSIPISFSNKEKTPSYQHNLVNNTKQDTIEINDKKSKKLSKIKKYAYTTAGIVIIALATAKIILGYNKIKKIAQNKKVFSDFCTTTKYDEVLKNFSFTHFGKDGVPLKYSRNKFIQDLKAILNSLPQEERLKLEKKYNLDFRQTGYNSVKSELSKIPVIPEKIVGNKAEQKIAKLIRHFTKENEVMVENKEIKSVLNSIIQEIPEFTTIIGRKQHDTHHYSIDIHTLKNLCDNIKNPMYTSLDEESKLVLKYSTILHDFGKDFLGDYTPDKGHAQKSFKIAPKILEKIDLKQNIKDRIIKQVKNHHWFEYYNKGEISAQDVVKMFESKQDVAIAEIMAKSDFKNVNPDFHYLCMKITKNDSYDDLMRTKFSPIDIIITKIN